MVRKMFVLLIALAGDEESRGGILGRGVLASRQGFWFKDTLVENCCRRSMHIHINETKEQAREKKGERAWSLTEEIALWKVGLGKIESSKARTFRPQNESATCMYGWVVDESRQHRKKVVMARVENNLKATENALSQRELQICARIQACVYCIQSSYKHESNMGFFFLCNCEQ